MSTSASLTVTGSVAAILAVTAAITAVGDTTEAMREADGSADGLDGCMIPATVWEFPTPTGPWQAGLEAAGSVRVVWIAGMPAAAGLTPVAGDFLPTPVQFRTGAACTQAPRETGRPAPDNGAASAATGHLRAGNRMRAVSLRREARDSDRANVAARVPTSGHRPTFPPRTGGAATPLRLKVPAATARRGTSGQHLRPAGHSRVDTQLRATADPSPPDRTLPQAGVTRLPAAAIPLLRRFRVPAATAVGSGLRRLPAAVIRLRGRSPLRVVLGVVDTRLRAAVSPRRDRFPLLACRVAEEDSPAAAAFPADTGAVVPSADAGAVDVTGSFQTSRNAVSMNSPA